MADAGCIELQQLDPGDGRPLIDRTASDHGRPKSHHKAWSWLRSRQATKTQDWKKTLYLGSILTVVVLTFNLGFVLWAADHQTLHNGRGAIFSGDCEEAKRINIGFHVVINILGTILLGASNYGMQCLCAPTRQDIDRAHSKGEWMDVGVQSIRNLWQIPRTNLFLWLALAVSSLPLHLVYNSAVFQTIAAYKYDIFIGDKPFTAFNPSSVRPPARPETEQAFRRMMDKGLNGELDRFDQAQCITNYANQFQTQHGNLLLVADHFNSSRTDFDLFGGVSSLSIADPYDWICYAYEDYWETGCAGYVPQLLHADQWKVIDYGYHTESYQVEYCLSEKVPQRCTVEYSLPLALVVMVVNVLKGAILWGVTLIMKDSPLLTTGDAISSFMRNPDSTTEGRCLLSRDQVAKPAQLGSTFTSQRRHWGSAVSRRRWWLCLILYAVCMAACIALLCIGIYAQMSQPAWSVGLGEANPITMIQGDDYPTSLVANTLIANTPQAVFSVLYFASNGIYTAMALAKEWSDYAVERKGLRVSRTPEGSQRSTYFLSLPYRYSIPLLTFSGVLHWLMSQSLYLVSIRAYNDNLTWDPASDRMTCGYSPRGITSVLVVGGVMVACLVGLAFRRLKSGMPVAGSCSLAISAACHPAKDGQRVETPVQWGVEVSSLDRNHCAFSSGEVAGAVEGEVYL